MITKGDIRPINNGSLDRLVLVLKVDEDSNTCQFTLVHSYVEFATEFDIIVEPEVTQLRYSLVVETDLRGSVSTTKLGKRIATVPSSIVSACYEDSINLVETSEVFVGPPMLGPLDARWDFKVEEGNTIRLLSAELLIH
jgi:hypothetical protein